MKYQDIKTRLDDKITEYKKQNPEAMDSDFKYKRCKRYLVVLFIPKTIRTNESRSHIADKRFAKFRAEKAYCVAIWNTKT